MLDKSIQYPVKRILLAFVFCETLLISVNAMTLRPHDGKKWVIVIDAGHGGKDPGCHGLHYKEKDVALAVALKLGHLIQENDTNVKVIYTRSTDVFIPLNERAEIADRNHADFFICVHCNASPDKTKYGSATYVMGLYKSEGNLEVSKRENASILYEKDYKQTYGGFDPNSDEANILFAMYQNAYLAQSLDLAAKIQKEYVSEAGRVDNGVKQAGFLVLWKTTMPSLLTEMGFLTNPQEELFIGSKRGQTKIAESIFLALQQYIDEKEGVAFNRNDFNLIPAQPDSTAVKDTAPQGGDTQEKATASITAMQPEPAVSSQPDNATKFKASIQNLHPDSVGKPGIDSAPKPTVVSDTATIIYKVQLASSPKPLATDTGELKNVPGVEMYIYNHVYKYTAGHFTSLDDAIKLQSKLRTEGFKDAFIVAFKGKNRVPVGK